jgi:hypothetical protein
MNLDLINEKTKATGIVRITKTNSIGQITEEFEVPNLVVTTGKNFIAGKIVATTNSPVAMTHMAIGTGSATPAAGDTALGTQTARVALSSAAASNNTVTFTATFPAGTGDGALTEAGVFNASSGGTMLCRTTYPVVTKGAGDAISITWIITIS